MDFVGLFRIESPFPFVAAVVAVSADRVATLGDCFLFVENRGNFIGFQRVKMPSGILLDDAQVRMRQEVRRIHIKMCNAARRKGILPQIEMDSLDPGFVDAPLGLLSDLWNNRGFDELLDWVGKTTASALLRAEIDRCRGPASNLTN